MRFAVWLGLGAIGASAGAGAGGCLRDTEHACEVAGACGNGADAAIDDAAGDRDGRVDADTLAVDANNGVIEHVPLDEEMLGTQSVTVSDNRTLNTSTLQFNGGSQPWLTVITTEQGNQVALARLDTLTINQGRTLDVNGSLPLVIIARQIDVIGTIDASANGSNDGPGAILGGAPGGGDGLTGANNDDGGGGGGGHATRGASGGDTEVPVAGAPGELSGDAILTRLEGGGRGGRGASANCARALGGGGGGGLQLYAAETLAVTGTIDVSGGGGQRNGACAAGGGGGGAGGAIYLQSSTMITLGGISRLAANGGGGASGGGVGPGSDGSDGEAGPLAASGGGPVSGGGAPGGAGGAGDMLPVDGGDATTNAGGGGGAVGRIVVHAPAVNGLLGAQSSPMFVRR